MTNVITRFAPSPTGFLHIGGAWIALFNYLYARANGGKYLLRIEDTDRERSTEPAIAAIINGLDWMGLKADEPPIFQFARMERHAEIAQQLVATGKAYYCYTSAEELAHWREENKNKRFISKWRDGAPPGDGKPVVRLRSPLEGKITVKDRVKGEVSVDAAELDDMVLLRSDGTPTYMLAVVVDDHDMGITHVIRGNDHFTNTFRQKLIYDALGWETPEFAHVPMILGPDGTKLSKRHGAQGVDEYQKMGYLPEALRNYLLRLGWSHGDDEIISDDQGIKWFNLEHIGTSPARFDFDKLADLNLHYIKLADNERLVELINPLLSPPPFKGEGWAGVDRNDQLLLKAMPFLKERSKTLVVLAEDAKFLFDVTFDDKAQEKIKSFDKALTHKIVTLLSSIVDWNKPALEAAIHKFMETENLKMGQIGPILRILLTGTMSSPGIYDVMSVLGRDEVLKRLNFGL